MIFLRTKEGQLISSYVIPVVDFWQCYDAWFFFIQVIVCFFFYLVMKVHGYNSYEDIS